MLKNSKQKIALDISSTNIKIWSGSQDVATFNSTLLVEQQSGEIIGQTNDSKSLFSEENGMPIEMVAPFSRGVVAHTKYAKYSLSLALSPYLKGWSFARPDVICTIPLFATQADREVLFNLLGSFPFSKIYLVDTPLAGSVGAGIPVSTSFGHGVFCVDEDSLQGAIISMSTLISKAYSNFGIVDALDFISTFLINNYSLSAPLDSLKPLINSVFTRRTKSETSQTHELTGTDVVFGTPVSKKIKLIDIYESSDYVRMRFMESFRSLISQTPPQLAADIIEKGVVLVGNLSLIPALPRFLTEELSVPVHTAEDCEFAIVRGAGYIIENIDLWKRSVSLK